MLGHSGFGSDYRYRLQTLKDNLKLFTPEILARIDRAVIAAGYRLSGQDIHAPIGARCDSFVVETDVHFPTDINLLDDAIRILIRDCVRWSEQYPLPGWRQHAYNLRQFKKQYRKLQKMKHSTSRNEAKKAAREHAIEQAYRNYLDLARVYRDRASASLASLQNDYPVPGVVLADRETFCRHAERQIDQIRRRALEGETIPHEEKVFSLFEPHTEWISKGKAGVPVELGLRVCILEDSRGFILHSQVMQKLTDDKVAVPLIQAAPAKFPGLNACSFDQGFHSPSNQQELKDRLDHVVLPKKGKCSKAEQQRESAPEFKRARQQHSAVESAINALEVHGLDSWRDSRNRRFRTLRCAGRVIAQHSTTRCNYTQPRKATAGGKPQTSRLTLTIDKKVGL
jgi:hypothetical protein